MPTFQEYTSRSFGHKVNKSARLMSQRMAHLFKENGYNISIEQWRLLLYLWREDGVTQNYLADTTSKDEPSVSRIINTMEKNNLVIRTRHPHDRRTNLIYLTESGRDLRDGLMTIGARMNKDITEGIDPDELSVCVKVLEKVLDNCNKLLEN
ncbi:transcriptional regulator [Desulfitobacterium dichloroeliminans LMG P-21439]|uniref:Transcriptional regulator n=1 Tax=Desulfitobacterium dichloroeliminans (strain LMG P-21439 / DCA1) TaxID=871963 RepID=L0F707_DESDL|nr:MarR family winged helix-turn-helix transcriptional regulator [Desulfitobacterium dichloroeliminans]AGA68436.1 transcriptional regulator [Desulfitobacterium dichloroeliminans LMG P-21439]